MGVRASASKCAPYPKDEAGTPENDTESDADENAGGRGVELVVGKEPEEHAAHDAADQETAEADEVTAA